nr:transmembrane protease serine 9-like [Lytechinus pictus]
MDPLERPCRSACVELENKYHFKYENQTGLEWPLDCNDFPDSMETSDGSCTGPDGDLLNTAICGTRPAYTPFQSSVTVEGGVHAEDGEFPWMVYLHDEHAGQFCSGTLLGREWVITSAHCVSDLSYNLDSIVLGDLSRRYFSQHHISRDVSQVFTHPAYDGNDYDIALVKLKNSVEFSDTVRPVCFPAKTVNEMKVYHRCMVSGWGDRDISVSDDHLKRSNVRMFTDVRYCSTRLSGHRITERMVCAKYDRQSGFDRCQADRGGPLVCQGVDGRWHLVGVKNWGNDPNCVDTFEPLVFASVSHLLPFINDVLFPTERNLSTPSAEENTTYAVPVSFARTTPGPAAETTTKSKFCIGLF